MPIPWEIRSAESDSVIFEDPERSVLDIREHRKLRKARPDGRQNGFSNSLWPVPGMEEQAGIGQRHRRQNDADLGLGVGTAGQQARHLHE
jgi:hypothetical protein